LIERKGLMRQVIFAMICIYSYFWIGCDSPQQHRQNISHAQEPASASTKTLENVQIVKQADRPKPLPAQYMIDILYGTTTRTPKEPNPYQMAGFDEVWLSGEQGKITVSDMLFPNGDHVLLVHPCRYVPVRITGFGLSGQIQWSVNPTTVAIQTTDSTQAILQFKEKDTKTILTARTGDEVVLRLEITTIAQDDKEKGGKIWRIISKRQNANGISIDCYGRPEKK